MPNNICNIRHVDGSNYAQHLNLNNTGQIACGLCNRVLISTQALITHIESHMAYEEVAIRRLYSPSQHHISHHFPPPPPPPPPPNFPVQMQLQETRNFVDRRVFQVPPPGPPQAMMMPTQRRNPFCNASHSQFVIAPQPVQQFQLAPPSPQVLLSAGNNNEAETEQRKMEESPIDGTKAFIKLLEKPIKKIEFIDLVELDDDDDDSDLQTLDLALKL